MRSIILKILLIVNLLIIYNCKSQTTIDYIAFYNEVVPKLNAIIPNKVQFYGQNFSNFSTELHNKNVNITMFFCEPKTDPGTKYYVLKLFLCDVKMLGIASENAYVYPRIIITFQNEIPLSVDGIIQENSAQWNLKSEQFFANMKIEKIDFIGVKGYNVNDFTE